MDKADWADRLEKEAEACDVEARGCAAESVRWGNVGARYREDIDRAAATRAMERAKHLRALRSELGIAQFDSMIGPAHEAVDAGVERQMDRIAKSRAASAALETRAILASCLEPGERITGAAFELWASLDDAERGRLRRVFGDEEHRVESPCDCDAPVHVDHARGSQGLQKCVECCAAWPIQDGRGRIRPVLVLPYERRWRERQPSNVIAGKAGAVVGAGQFVALNANGDVVPVSARPKQVHTWERWRLTRAEGPMPPGEYIATSCDGYDGARQCWTFTSVGRNATDYCVETTARGYLSGAWELVSGQPPSPSFIGEAPAGETPALVPVLFRGQEAPKLEPGYEARIREILDPNLNPEEWVTIMSLPITEGLHVGGTVEEQLNQRTYDVRRVVTPPRETDGTRAPATLSVDCGGRTWTFTEPGARR